MFIYYEHNRITVSTEEFLVDLFKTRERVKILRYISIRETFSVTSVTTGTQVSKGLVSQYLNLLIHERLLNRDNRSIYRNDTALWDAIKLILNLDLLRNSIALPSWAEGIGIYGSWAEGKNNLESDLDVWVFIKDYDPDLELKMGELQRDLGAATGSDVHALLLTKNKLENLKIQDASFYANLKNNHLTVCGEDFDNTR